MHSKSLIYRDLKPENVLIQKSGYLKLTDFGFIKQLKPGERTYTFCGTPEYLAPEILQYKGHGKAVDWYTLGIFLYELIVGHCPFTHDDPLKLFEMIIKMPLTFPRDDKNKIDPDAKDLIRRLTQHDLSKRIGNLRRGSEDIRNHYFFSQSGKLYFQQVQS